MEEDSKPSAALASGEVAAPLAKMMPLVSQQHWTVSPDFAAAFDFSNGKKKRGTDLFPHAEETKKSRILRMDEKLSVTTTSIETLTIQDLVATCSLTLSETDPMFLDEERSSGRKNFTGEVRSSMRRR